MAGEGSSQAEVALGAREGTGADLVIAGPEKQVRNPRPAYPCGSWRKTSARPGTA